MGTATVVLRRLREAARLRGLASRLGWPLVMRGREAVSPTAYEFALMSVGHSRRFGAVFQATPELRVFSYVYESGTEADRLTHTWRMATCPAPQRVRWLLVSCEPWLLAAAAVQHLRPIDLKSHLEADAPAPRHQFWTDDPEFWHSHMTPRLAAFLSQQSTARSWEILPNLAAAFEPGPSTEREMAAMADQVGRFSQLLSEALASNIASPAAVGSPAV